jgi:hypothetical protein
MITGFGALGAWLLAAALFRLRPDSGLSVGRIALVALTRTAGEDG